MSHPRSYCRHELPLVKSDEVDEGTRLWLQAAGAGLVVSVPERDPERRTDLIALFGILLQILDEHGGDYFRGHAVRRLIKHTDCDLEKMRGHPGHRAEPVDRRVTSDQSAS